jgi:hypothetical protein
MSGARRTGTWAALIACLLAAGCELTEVVTAPAEDVLVVEAVLRAGESRQVVLLHRALDGDVVRGEPAARVTLRPVGGEAVVLAEAPQQRCLERTQVPDADSIRVEATCYSSASGQLPVRPGETYELQVETLDGRRLRGRTQVPGDFRLLSPALDASRTCTLPPGSNLPVVWSRSAGTWSYIATLEVSGLDRALAGQGINAPEWLELTGLAISERDTTILLPAQFGIFERTDFDQSLLRLLQLGFPAGAHAELTVAAADRNFVNSVRGGGFNPSGNVRVSSVFGDGVGVFGSLVVRRAGIQVTTATSTRPCLRN